VLRRLPGAGIGPVLGLAATLMAGGLLLRSDAARRDRDVMVVYIGAEDCAPCLTWQRNMEADFRASAEFARLTYREVKAPTLFAVLSDEVWPADLRGYRAHIDAKMGVPMWIVVADGSVVAQDFGASRWVRTLLPTLRSLMR